MDKLAPRCYVCGEPVGKAFVLAAMQTDVDRVFVSHEKCSRQMTDTLLLPVAARG